MNRRDFPRLAARAAGGALALLDGLVPEPPPPAADEVALVRLGWRAMACGWQILVPLGAPAVAESGQRAFELLDAVEDQLTVYRDHSEVCRLNRAAPRRAVRVEEGLFNLLQLAARLHRDSAGAYDITAGALVKAWGFFRGPRRVPSDDEIARALARTGMHHVEFDATARSVRYRAAGLEVNLGSIGKGWALDRMNELLARRANWPAVLLHGGSSSVYARGCPHGEGRGWRVAVRHPWTGAVMGEVLLRDRALGTSAATFQHLEHNGRKLGHVLDPRTGWPAAGLDSVSVVAPTAAEADALSTALFVGGAALARRYCSTRPDVGVILLSEGAAEPEVVGLSRGEYTLPSDRVQA